MVAVTKSTVFAYISDALLLKKAEKRLFTANSTLSHAQMLINRTYLVLFFSLSGAHLFICYCPVSILPLCAERYIS